MRIVAAAALLATIAFAREGNAQSRYRSSVSASGRGRADCKLHSCGVPAFGIIFGGASTAYVGAWMLGKGELPVAAHIGGALVGSMSTTAAILFATTNNPAPRYQAFGTVACLAVGLPALVLGLHGLITADAERDEVKPGPVPNWYGPGLMRVHGGPSAVADVRGALSPGLSFGGAF